MEKKAGVLFVLLFLLITNQAEAHTTLKESMPADGQVIEESVQELTLIFSTKVEKVSTITVSASNSESVEVIGTSIEEDVVKVDFSEPLPNESYEVSWDIIGADGHSIEGLMTFTVDVQENQEPATEQPNPTEDETSEPVNTAKAEGTDSEQTKYGSSTVYIILGVAVLVVIGCFWWMLKRKK